MITQKRIGIAAGLVLLLFAAFLGGVGVGRRHAETTTKTEYRDVVKEKVVTQDVIKTVVVHDQVDRVRVVHEDRVETRPDGTRIETKRDSDDATKEKKDTDRREQEKTQVVEKDRIVERIVTQTTPVRPPRWILSLDAGTSFPALRDARLNKVPGAPGWLSAGATVERRLLGPLWVGTRVGADASVSPFLLAVWAF